VTPARERSARTSPISEFKTVEARQLHRRLTQLKNKWQDKLYVKIIIPEMSGPTYNEAWSFTKDIISRYDYYYQERKKDE